VFLNLAINLFFFVRSFGRIFFPETFAALGSDSMEVATAGFFFAGLPVVMLGLWAITVKDEILLRTYWFYLILCCSIAAGFLLQALLVPNCESLPGALNLKDSGSGAFCGLFSIASKVLLGILLANFLYCIYVIWSLCTHFWYNNDKLKDWLEVPAGGSYSTLANKRLPGSLYADQPCCNALCGACGCGICCSPGTPCGECSSCCCTPGAPCGACCASGTTLGDIGITLAASLGSGGAAGRAAAGSDPCSLCCGCDPCCCCPDCCGNGRSYETANDEGSPMLWKRSENAIYGWPFYAHEVDFPPKQHHLV